MDDDFDIKECDEKVDCCYGLETFIISDNDIKALNEGKKLYTTVNCGEYAIVIQKLKESEET